MITINLTYLQQHVRSFLELPIAVQVMAFEYFKVFSNRLCKFLSDQRKEFFMFFLASR